MAKYFKLIFYFIVTFIYLTGIAIDDVLYNDDRPRMGFAFDKSFGGRRVKLFEYLNMVIQLHFI